MTKLSISQLPFTKNTQIVRKSGDLERALKHSVGTPAKNGMLYKSFDIAIALRKKKKSPFRVAFVEKNKEKKITGNIV